MDSCSITDESANDIVMDSPSTERRAQETSQSAIPEVSLCPPDSLCPEAQATLIQTEGDQSDSCSLPRPSSSTSSQLYHQVLQGGAYDSPQTRRCHFCGHHKPIKGNACLESHPITVGPPHADCSTGALKTCSPSFSCHNAVSCHWLHGSHDGGGPHKSKQHHVVTVRDDGLYWIPRNYSQVVLEYPLAVLVGCAVVLLGCSLAGLLIGPLPDFSDPLMGFEPRGTYIGVRQSALAKLQQNTGPGKTLSLIPQQLKDKTAGSYGDGSGGDASGTQEQSSRQRPRRMLDRDSAQDTFLCDSPGDRYAQLVFRSGNSASLWSLKAIYSMCEMEQERIRSQPHFQDLCKQHIRLEVDGAMIRGGCCPSWSLGNYLALLSNASSCLSLTSLQVTESLHLLRFCAPYYHDGSLVAYCAERGKQGHSSVTAQAWKPCCTKSPGGFWDTSSRKRCLFTFGQKLRGLKRGLSDTSNVLFLKILPCGVVKFRYIWVCWFTVLAAGGTYISVIDPASEPRSSTSAANGAFGRSSVQRNFNKDRGNYLYPNQQRHRQRQVGGGRESAQYELQPLAYQLSESFENSTCTSKLSNRPSVLSDDIQFGGLSPRRDVERSNIEADSEEICGRHHKGCHPPPALQTSSPYKENTLGPVVAPPGDLANEKLLCKMCRGQSAGIKHWNVSLSSSSSIEETIISQTIETIYQPSLSKDEAPNSPFEHHSHKRLLSTQSSFDALEDSNETCLSDAEPGPSNQQISIEAEGELEPQPGHLNGKRDTLRLSLREITYETVSPGCGRGHTSLSEGPVMLPNSKPDLPDVWIKRDGPREDTN
ncbi:hypothetical protein J4Q44_G00247060 [Coregonus suidteri]|uniref:Uncharacterized protein n=1 Tax=Coregonus suidteri TaxID=861788 RepID=A0AAN8LDG1_9TELE